MKGINMIFEFSKKDSVDIKIEYLKNLILSLQDLLRKEIQRSDFLESKIAALEITLENELKYKIK